MREPGPVLHVVRYAAQGPVGTQVINALPARPKHGVHSRTRKPPVAPKSWRGSGNFGINRVQIGAVGATVRRHTYN